MRLGPARQGPLALGPGGGAGGAAFPSRARARSVSISCCATGLATALGLLALDADDSRAPKGSLRKFLEHLSGSGKAIGVLTSGGHAQGARPAPGGEGGTDGEGEKREKGRTGRRGWGNGAEEGEAMGGPGERWGSDGKNWGEQRRSDGKNWGEARARERQGYLRGGMSQQGSPRVLAGWGGGGRDMAVGTSIRKIVSFPPPPVYVLN